MAPCSALGGDMVTGKLGVRAGGSVIRSLMALSWTWRACCALRPMFNFILHLISTALFAVLVFSASCARLHVISYANDYYFMTIIHELPWAT
jgi:hypothetical protein